MSYHPASQPLPITDPEEVRQIIAAPEAALEVGRQVREGDKLRDEPLYDRSIPLLTDLLMPLDDGGLLSIPKELWRQLLAVDKQGMLDRELSRRLRGLSKKKR